MPHGGDAGPHERDVEAGPPGRGADPHGGDAGPHDPGPDPRGGLVLVDKERGPSSFAVVRRVRGRFGMKAGHAGTLDPLATGLLVCLVGRSTRLARYLVGLDKRYETMIQLGLRTTTGDAEGEPLEETAIPTPAELEALRGDLDLPIPAASAVKVGGERAYRLHRLGVAVDMPTRRSTVHGLEILRFEPPEAELALHVSSGTYVRAIANALGGHCVTLRRTAVGPFRFEDADEERLLPPLAAVAHLPERRLTQDELALVRTGRSVPAEGTGPIALVGPDGTLAGVAQVSGGEARPETVLS